jgi:predicted DNA-binding antitoxin AbrB/MazE fold protein
MSNSIRAIVKEGRIELLEKVELREGTEVLVTPLTEEADFWLKASENSIDAIWDNSEDDVYARLLKE